jgi:hypothetical protein
MVLGHLYVKVRSAYQGRAHFFYALTLLSRFTELLRGPGRFENPRHRLVQARTPPA